MALHLTGDPGADRLLSTSPLAVLIGMLLDQQVPLEWAFQGPRTLEERLGRPLDATEIAMMDPDELAAIFATKPAIHRYPGSMAKRTQALCDALRTDYDGEAASLWTTATSGSELLRRLKGLPGFGEQKAKIFLALLAKQLDVRPDGWEAACAPYGETGSYRSVADIVDPESLAMVREHKAAMKKAAKDGPST